LEWFLEPSVGRLADWFPDLVEGWLPGSQGRVPDLPLVYPVERAAVVAA